MKEYEIDFMSHEVIFYCPVKYIESKAKCALDTYVIINQECCMARLRSIFIDKSPSPIADKALGAYVRHQICLSIDAVTVSFNSVITSTPIATVGSCASQAKKIQEYLISCKDVEDFESEFEQAMAGLSEILITLK